MRNSRDFIFKMAVAVVGVFLITMGTSGCAQTPKADDDDINIDDDNKDEGDTDDNDTDDNDTDDNDTNDDDDNGDNGNGETAGNCTAPDWDSPWPMFRGYENHLGLSDVPGPQDTNSVWTFEASSDVGNPPNSIAIGSDGTIYLAGGGEVHSIDPTTHQANWSKSYTSAQGPALSADETALYFGSKQSIVAVQTSDGAEQWTYETEGEVHFGPTIGTDGTVYQGSWDQYFYAINANDGSLKWRYQTEGAVSYPPTILNCDDTGELVILGGGDAHEGEDGNIYAFDTDGNLKWSYDTERLRVGTPVFGPDGLIYAPGGPTLYVLNTAGELQWSIGDEQTYNFGIISPAIGSDGTIYQPNSGGQDAARVYAINPDTEAVITGWPYELDGDDNGIPTFPVVDSEGTVYFGDTTNGNIYAVDSSGNLVFTHETDDAMAEASPALVDGVLYISSDDGKLYVIGE